MVCNLLWYLVTGADEGGTKLREQMLQQVGESWWRSHARPCFLPPGNEAAVVGCHPGMWNEASVRLNDQMNERTTEWINEQMNEWTHEWINECIRKDRTRAPTNFTFVSNRYNYIYVELMYLAKAGEWCLSAETGQCSWKMDRWIEMEQMEQGWRKIIYGLLDWFTGDSPSRWSLLRWQAFNNTLSIPNGLILSSSHWAISFESEASKQTWLLNEFTKTQEGDKREIHAELGPWH